ncbi:MAG: hypothetical protein NVSMB1_04380 [Polyangiales bacterium]
MTRLPVLLAALAPRTFSLLTRANSIPPRTAHYPRVPLALICPIVAASMACQGVESAPADNAEKTASHSFPEAEVGATTVVGARLVNDAQRRFKGQAFSLLLPSEVDSLRAEGRSIRAISSAARFQAETIQVLLPRSFDRALSVASDGMGVSVTPHHVSAASESVAVEWAQHIAVYPEVESGVHAFRRITNDGVEDLYEVTAPRADLSFSYDVALRGVAGLRLVEGTLELLDDTGNPRLRAPAPIVFDARGAQRKGRIAVVGCAYDTNALSPWGRKVTPPGADACVVTATIHGRGLSYPVLVDPSWVSTFNTKNAHAYHVMLPISGTSPDSGKVLLLGGSGSIPTTTELFNPATKTWSTSTSLSMPFAQGEGAAVLSDGTVIVTGGFATVDGFNPAQSSVLTRNPATGVWSGAAAMSSGRAFHTMQVVKSSTGKELVLIAGGQPKDTLSSTSPPLKSAELYDPATDNWKGAGAMSTGHAHAGSALLGDGRVLIAGGDVYSAASFGDAGINAVDIYDPVAGIWSSAAPMTTKRGFPTVVGLGGNRVIAAGGMTEVINTLDSIEYFDGTAWTALSVKLSEPRRFAAGTLMFDGRVLITGGDVSSSTFSATPTSSADLLNPGTDPKFSTISTTGGMAYPRYHHAAISLGAKGVLVTGGLTGDSAGTETTSSEIFDFTIGAKCTPSTTCPGGTTCVDSVCCNSASCPSGQTCNAPGHEGACTKPKGALCATNAECATGYCVTGVCCTSSCSGGCKACNTAAALGTCVAAQVGTDPGGFCAAGGDDCSTKCDALGGCTVTVPEGTPCGTSAADAGPSTSFCNRHACSSFGSCELITYNCGLTCTTKVTCNEAAKSCTPIVSGIKGGNCVIDNACFSYGDPNPKDPTKCQI